MKQSTPTTNSQFLRPFSTRGSGSCAQQASGLVDWIHAARILNGRPVTNWSIMESAWHWTMPELVIIS